MRGTSAFAKTIPVGDGLDENSVLGPIQNRMQFDKVARLTEAAKKAGGRVLLGGKRRKRACSFRSTLIADLDNGNPLVDDEQFGPVLPIIRYSDVDEVIARANDNPHGLGGSVWSKDVQKAKDIALQLQCGTAWINKHRPDSAECSVRRRQKLRLRCGVWGRGLV